MRTADPAPQPDLPGLVLENDLARIVVLPDAGAMIHQFIYKPAGRDVLFHHPRIPPRRAYYRAPVDDWWSGGVIEGMPTCFACIVGGESLPEFGELWSEPWTVVSSSASAATVACKTRLYPLQVTRSMRLVEDSASLRMRHIIDNLSHSAVQVLWGIHPTAPVGPSTNVQVPSRTEELVGLDDIMTIADPVASRLAKGPVCFTDLATAPQSLSYLSGLPRSAWFAIWDDDWQTGLGMTFSGVDLPCVWLWLVDGWRGLRSITLEPWTGWPGSLDEAVRLGRAISIPGGGTIALDTALIAFTPVGPLRGFDVQGCPIPAGDGHGTPRIEGSDR
jgi:hypothetical protein